MLPPDGKKPKNQARSSTWADHAELSGLDFKYHKGRLILGQWRDGDGTGHLIGFSAGWRGAAEDRHLITIAGSGSGKSSTVIRPNLLTYTGSMFIIDPKGEHAALELNGDERTGIPPHWRRDKLGQKIRILDPFGVVGGADRLNPFEGIQHADPLALSSWLAEMESALIIPDAGKDAHWTSGAASLLRFYLLWMLATPDHENGEPSFGRLDLLIRGAEGTTAEVEDNIFKQAAKLAEGTGNLPLLRSALSLDGQQGLASYSSTLAQQLRFIEDMALTQDGASTFSLADIKREKVTVYLVLPASKIATHSRWLRLLLVLTTAEMERGKNPDQDVVFLLEEFASLGFLATIQSGIALARSYGVKYWIILQDLTQLRTHYRESWETFLDNAGAIQAFGNAGVTTCEYLSKRMGQKLYTPRTFQDMGSAALAGAGSMSHERREWMPLMHASEIPQAFPRWRDVDGNTVFPLLLITKEHNPANVERLPFEWVP